MFEVHTIELRKKPSEDDPLKEWMEFFNAESEEELDMIQTKNPGLMEAIREIKRLGMGRAARAWYEANQKVRRDQRAREAYVREEGRAEGLEEGRAEERKNTEREKGRADQLERKVQELQEELKRYRQD